MTSAAADLERAAVLLREGEAVAIPTETVYGLAADALDPAAVAKIFAAKGRPADNPLIVHIADIGQLDRLVTAVPDTAGRLAAAFWPGPLTLILPRSGRVPDIVSAGLPTVAVRLPAHPAARSIITLAGCPLAAPSANRSGSPSPTCAAHVLADLDGRIAAVVDGGPCVVGVESTVLDFSSDPPRLLRPGGIPAELLRELCPELAIDPAVWAPPAADQPARSPGTKYIHYAPRATVIMVKGDAAAYTAYVNAHAAPGTAALCFAGEESGLAVPYITYGCRNNPEEQARLLFSALRSADEIGAKELLAACPEPAGMGLAVYNRLLRAAGFRVVNAECGMRNAELPH